MGVLSYKGVDFASTLGAINEHVPDFASPERAWKLVDYPGVDGLDALNMGLRGREINYRCHLYMADEASLKIAEAAIRALDDGTSGTLVATGVETLGPVIIASGGIRFGKYTQLSDATGSVLRELRIRFIELYTP